MVKRGDVWWARTSIGRRPVLVLTRDEAIPLLGRLVCAGITSTVRSVPSELMLDEDDGMPMECVVSFDNLMTVPKTRLDSCICSLDEERMSEICPTLAVALGC